MEGPATAAAAITRGINRLDHDLTAQLCAGSDTPTAKDIVSPLAQTQTNPVVCYKVKCPKQAARTWVVTDQFGTHTLTAKSPGMLCAPACLPTGGSCLSNTTCCSGTCTALVCL